MAPRVVAYGGGTNSTAMLIGMAERGMRPDLILFADTGAELPATYDHLRVVSEWCASIGFPEIVTVVQVKQDGYPNYLEPLCLEKKMLPSIAYGYKTCSQKHKIAPQDKYVNNWNPAIDCWTDGGRVEKYIGYDAGESRRAKEFVSDKYRYNYPLIEWNWYREDCKEAIERAGLPQPGKSSCFFCPSSKPAEILALPPDLLERALALEANADLTHIKGLGRNWSWADLVRADRAQMDMFKCYTEAPCGCYDGGDE